MAPATKGGPAGRARTILPAFQLTSSPLAELATCGGPPYPAPPDFPLFRGQNKPLYAFLHRHMPPRFSAHSFPGSSGGKVVAPAAKGGAAGMVQEEYDSKISRRPPSLPLEGNAIKLRILQIFSNRKLLRACGFIMQQNHNKSSHIFNKNY